MNNNSLKEDLVFDDAKNDKNNKIMDKNEQLENQVILELENEYQESSVDNSLKFAAKTVQSKLSSRELSESALDYMKVYGTKFGEISDIKSPDGIEPNSILTEFNQMHIIPTPKFDKDRE